MGRVADLLRGLGCEVRTLEVPSGKPAKWDAADAAEDEIHALLRTADTPRPRIPILSIDDLMHLPPPRWLVDGLLVENGLSVIYGPSESFKSFVALDIALSISCGSDWRGHACDGGPVVYVIGEGVAGWPARVLTWLERRSGGAQAAFWTVPVGVAMTEKDDASALLESIQSVCERPVLIVLDTLARNFGAGDENSTQDMNAFVSSVDKLRQATGAHVMLVHHTGKDADKGARGSSVLRAALDTEMQCDRMDFSQPFVAFNVTKQKDIEKREPIMFEMVQAEAVHPVTGEVITSLFPVLSDKPEPQTRISDTAVILLKALENGPKTYRELEEETSIAFGTIKRVMLEMDKIGEVYASTVGQLKVWTRSV